MELLAAIHGLEAVPTGSRCVLHTDCTTLLVVRDAWYRDTILEKSRRDRDLWVKLGEQLDRVDAEFFLLVRGHRDVIHRRAHVIAGAEANAGLGRTPKTNSVDDRRIRKAMRRMLDDPLHHPHCDSTYCSWECPVARSGQELGHAAIRRSL